jgi:hypothetical protein
VSKYEFTENMREISGFGGSYEEGCRLMLKAGMEWFDENPDADPVFKGMEGVYGLMMENNDDANALSEAILNAPFVDPDTGEDTTVREYGATGAMRYAVITSVLWIKKFGWDAYVKEMESVEVK